MQIKIIWINYDYAFKKHTSTMNAISTEKTACFRQIWVNVNVGLQGWGGEGGGYQKMKTFHHKEFKNKFNPKGKDKMNVQIGER